MNSKASTHIVRADYLDLHHTQALVSLLDAYARDSMGGGKGLLESVKNNLPAALAMNPQAFSVLAFKSESNGVFSKCVGLINCFQGFSTFACKPLINVHDVFVLSEFRGHGIARQMFSLVQDIAKDRGACKLTLEVLSGNVSALNLYLSLGFINYQLDPVHGKAQYFQKSV